jgi:hypothetical protein
MKKVLSFVLLAIIAACPHARAQDVAEVLLIFSYHDKRQITDTNLVATVTRRDKPGEAAHMQRCSVEGMYAVGNYQITINTLPPITRNTDLNYGETVIEIPEAGIAEFTRDDSIKQTVLYRQEGKEFVPFDTLNVQASGVYSLKIQPGEYKEFVPFDTLNLQASGVYSLKIQPGEYEAHYRNKMAEEKVEKFYIKPGKTERVELE